MWIRLVGRWLYPHRRETMALLADSARTQMVLVKCPYCRLPLRLHFAWCESSEIHGKMPPESLTPGAIIHEAGELRLPKLGLWLDKRAKKLG
jgi:hypothetical protein